MSELKRYSPVSWSDIDEYEEGEIVRYDDAIAIIAEKDAKISALVAMQRKPEVDDIELRTDMIRKALQCFPLSVRAEHGHLFVNWVDNAIEAAFSARGDT